MVRLVYIPEDIYNAIENGKKLNCGQLSELEICILESEPYEQKQDNNILNVPMSEVISKVADEVLLKLKAEDNAIRQN